MGLSFNYLEGQTPLEEEEKEGLLLSIPIREELDEFEEQNIQDAIEWSLRISPGLDEILSEEFTKRVHKKMFSDVWKWAGSFRISNKNIGVDSYEIPQELHKLFDDCRYWIENRTMSEDEIAVRFKHRMVLIHPFANGNGRHSRLVGDILISKYFKKNVFSWSIENITKEGEARRKYLLAIRKADNGSYDDLITFARS